MTQHGLGGGTREALNAYGDHFIPAGSRGHGGHISNQRKDDLDRMALEKANALTGTSPSPTSPPTVYDIGCGDGAMAMEFARSGCAIVACDLEPMPLLAGFSQDSKKVPPPKIVQKDARLVDWTDYPKPDIVYSQRFLHYLRYDEAKKLLGALTGRGGKVHVFLSMSGLHSELGEGYPKQPLKKRFAHLARPVAEKHGIAQKVCLYSQEDAEKLASECGLTIVKLWLSDFGNVKLVARR